MFIQVITAPAEDAAGVRERWEAWIDECRPGAIGFRSGHGGVTPDGRAVLVAVFDDASSAAANAARSEQSAWWARTEPLFDGEPRFWESDDVTVTHGGPTATARFVQLMHARCDDRDAFLADEDAIGPAFLAHRPDVLGALRLWTPDGYVTAIDFFSSVEEARAGEAEEPPESLKEGFGRWMGHLTDTEWFDLPEAWHVTA